MSNEEENDFGFTQFLSKLRSLSRNKKILVVLSICLAASLVSYVGAALITGTSIFGAPSGPSNSVTPTPIPTAAPTATPVPTASPSPSPSPYSGTVGQATWVVASDPGDSNPSTYLIGSTLTISATLTPAPLTAQTVWFYYSNTPIFVDGYGIPTNPNQLSGIDTVVVRAGASTASVSFVVPLSSNTYYFIAEIPTPA